MQRFFTPLPLETGADLELPLEVAHQVTRVLRSRVGQQFVLVPGDRTEWEVEITEIAGKRVSVRVGAMARPDRELPQPLTIALAALKGERLEWAIQKLTELGATEIRLLLTERTVVAAGEDRWSSRMERYRRIAREAAEQSGRLQLPALMEPVPLKEFTSSLNAGPHFILDPFGDRALTGSFPVAPSSVTALVGPEGGFTPAEVQEARAAGILPVRLGRRVLRAETAAIAAGTLLADWLEREG